MPLSLSRRIWEERIIFWQAQSMLMQLESFCLAILLESEGGDEQKAHKSGSATAALPDTFIRTPLPCLLNGTYKSHKQRQGKTMEGRKKSAKLLVRKQTRASVLENGEFGGKGITCAKIHCISQCGIHSLHENQVKKGRKPSEEGENT